MSLRIIGLGRGIPKRHVTNDDLSALVDTDDAWIASRTGIRGRFVCTDESLTDLSTVAAEEALRHAGRDAEGIDLIIASTIVGDFRTPSLACCVAERMGARCPAFDLNAACSGFIYALETAAALLGGGAYRHILIVSAERMSAHMDWRDRGTCVLFGDGAAACVVTHGDALRYCHLSAAPDTQVLRIPNGTGNSPFAARAQEFGFLHMNGQEVFRFAVNTAEAEIRRALAATALSAEEIDLFLLHQANRRIIDAVRSKLSLPEAKCPVNLDRYGNLSSASVPLLLYERWADGGLRVGDTLCLCAFGAGLTAGCCVMIWE